LQKKRWTERFLVVCFAIPLAVWGMLLNSRVGVYLLQSYPGAFHALNWASLALFVVFLAVIAIETVFVWITGRMLHKPVSTDDPRL
jgi:hypothetical protein